MLPVSYCFVNEKLPSKFSFNGISAGIGKWPDCLHDEIVVSARMSMDNSLFMLV